MKRYALLVVMLSVIAAAQQAPSKPNVPPAPPVVVEPKHSEAVATLRAIEAEKHDLVTQRQNVISQVNALITGINNQVAEKDKDAEEQQAIIRKENGWDESYVYSPPQDAGNGTITPGHWQKNPTKK